MPKTPEELLAVRTKVAQEIFSTEKTYVESLNTLVEVYVKRYQDAAAAGKQNLLQGKEISTIFGNIAQIAELNGRFLLALQEQMESYNDNTCIGHVFNEYTPFFKMYVTYCNGHSRAVHDYRELCKKRDALRQFEMDAIANPKCKGLSLESFLIMPIQRVPRYKLLLTELLKNTPEGHADIEDLTSALELVSEVAVKINEEIRNRERRDQVLAIRDMFIGEVPELIAPGRFLVMEGDLMKVCRKTDKPFRFFLFSDLFLYAGKGTRPGTLVLHRQFPLGSGFLVVDQPESDKPAFQIRHAQKSFVVYAKDFDEKKKWLDALNNCIQEVQKMNARTQSANTETAPVWQPDSASTCCEVCKKPFSKVLNRRHHCRRCGRLVDNNCSKTRMHLATVVDEDKVRVCDICVGEIGSSEGDGNEIEAGALKTSGGSLTNQSTQKIKLFGDVNQDELMNALARHSMAPAALARQTSKEEESESDEEEDEEVKEAPKKDLEVRVEASYAEVETKADFTEVASKGNLSSPPKRGDDAKRHFVKPPLPPPRTKTPTAKPASTMPAATVGTTRSSGENVSERHSPPTEDAFDGSNSGGMDRLMPAGSSNSRKPALKKKMSRSMRLMQAIADYNGELSDHGFRLVYQSGDKVQVLMKKDDRAYVELLKSGVVGWVNVAHFENCNGLL